MGYTQNWFFIEHYSMMFDFSPALNAVLNDPVRGGIPVILAKGRGKIKMKLSLTTRRENGIIVLSRKKLLTLSFFCLLLSVLCITSAAHAVMPPAHYEKQVRKSAIKAIAVVKDVIVLSETKKYTHKKVVFTLEKPFDKNIPQEFTGNCYSVDHEWQKPGVGGTIYYYPVKGTKALVTITNNHNLITSFTPLDPGLAQEIDINGLTNISFVMGHAQIRSGKKQNSKKEQWFLFYLNGSASGYLHITSRADSLNPMIRQFSYELLVGELDKDRRLFRMNTQSRDDGLFTPEWITIQITEYSPEKTITHPQREITFRPVDRTDIGEGILVKASHNAYDVRIPLETATDFGLFTLVETFPYEKDFSVQINLIETLELHLKKNIQIRYMGKDSDKNNLHMFSETGRANATYWLDDRHELIELQWDRDKRFIRGTKDEAMTILQ